MSWSVEQEDPAVPAGEGRPGVGEGEGRRGPQGSGSSGELPGQRDGGRPAQRAALGGSGWSLARAGGSRAAGCCPGEGAGVGLLDRSPDSALGSRAGMGGRGGGEGSPQTLRGFCGRPCVDSVVARGLWESHAGRGQGSGVRLRRTREPCTGLSRRGRERSVQAVCPGGRTLTGACGRPRPAQHGGM